MRWIPVHRIARMASVFLAGHLSTCYLHCCIGCFKISKICAADAASHPSPIVIAVSSRLPGHSHRRTGSGYKVVRICWSNAHPASVFPNDPFAPSKLSPKCSSTSDCFSRPLWLCSPSSPSLLLNPSRKRSARVSYDHLLPRQRTQETKFSCTVNSFVSSVVGDASSAYNSLTNVANSEWNGATSFLGSLGNGVYGTVTCEFGVARSQWKG